MKTAHIIVTTAALLTLVACANDEADTELTSTVDSALRLPKKDEIVGPITYGESHTVHYEERPTYRAFRLDGKTGDTLDAWVRSTTGGDALLWVLRADGKTLARNDDADATTLDAHIALTLPRTEAYFIVMRDKDFEDNDYVVSIAGGGGSGAAVPAHLLGKSFTLTGKCTFKIEWNDYAYPTCRSGGYGWGEDATVTFAFEGTPDKPAVVASPFAISKVTSTSGEKRSVGWPGMRVALDPKTGRGRSSTRAHWEASHGLNNYCYAVSKGDTGYDAVVSGDKLVWTMSSMVQTNSCCSAPARLASCEVTLPQ